MCWKIFSSNETLDSDYLICIISSYCVAYITAKLQVRSLEGLIWTKIQSTLPKKCSKNVLSSAFCHSLFSPFSDRKTSIFFSISYFRKKNSCYFFFENVCQVFFPILMKPQKFWFCRIFLSESNFFFCLRVFLLLFQLFSQSWTFLFHILMQRGSRFSSEEVFWLYSFV